MTRKQAEKIADEIVSRARLAGLKRGDPQWLSVDITASPKILQALAEEPYRVVGCLPMGWRIARQRGDETLTVERSHVDDLGEHPMDGLVRVPDTTFCPQCLTRIEPDAPRLFARGFFVHPKCYREYTGGRSV